MTIADPALEEDAAYMPIGEFVVSVHNGGTQASVA